MSTMAAPIYGGMAAGVGGSLINSLFPGKAQKIGKASDVKQINPLSQPFYNQMQGFLGQYSPTANMGSVEGMMGGINNITNSLISPYGASRLEMANQIANQNMRDLQTTYGIGATNTGAAQTAFGKGMATPFAQAYTDVANMQANLGGNLAGSAYGQMGNVFQGALGNTMNLAAQKYWSPTYLNPQGNPMGNALGFLGGALPSLNNYWNTTTKSFQFT